MGPLKEKVHIGVVGAGHIATSHATKIRDTRGSVLTAVYDVDHEQAERFAQTFNVRRAPTLDALLAQCDAVFVCTWTASHREVVERAAACGRAVYCEKPLAVTLREAQAMAEDVRRAGVVNQVGLSQRRHPAFAVLRLLLADPDNGRVLAAVLHRELPNREDFTSGWRGDAAVAGGGVLLEVAFHDVDLLEWLVGPTEAIGALTCAGDHGRVEDAAAVSLRFSSGGVGTLMTVWHDVPGREAARSLRVVCEHAHYEVQIEGTSARLLVSGPDGRQREVAGDDLARMALELGVRDDPHEAFVRAVANGDIASPSFADAVIVHQLIDAAYRSAAQAGVVLSVDVAS